MKKIAKIVSAALVSLAFALPLSACGGGSIDLLKEDIIEDQYDNYYEIFVRSFYDSDGNGAGDFKGVTEKLSYVRDLGYTGIWLMPINPTDSYHGYDVKNYKAVNAQYGTIEDFEELVETAHSLGIKVIIDLVLNHSSNNHEWFRQGLAAYKSGDTSNKYVDYYNFSKTSQTGYRSYSGVYAEAQFDQSMPDLNLDCEELRDEIEGIIDFWIQDEHVDGFRLDAALHFYENDTEKSAEFTGWIKDRADESIREVNGEDAEAFVVGEVWAGATTIEDFFKGSHGATFFDFQTTQAGAQSYINEAINAAMHPSEPAPDFAASRFYTSIETVLAKAHGAVPTPFLDNHDVGRIAGVMLRDEDRIKFAYGLLSLYSGSTFTYYGDEIGMTGSLNDQEKRVGIPWDSNTKGIYPPGARQDPSLYYLFGNVESQLKDSTSILNYYKLCNNARNAFPALMRGTPARVENENANVLVFTKTYKDQSVTIAVNFSGETQTVKDLGDALTLKQGICVKGSVSGSGASLKIPAYGIAILA